MRTLVSTKKPIFIKICWRFVKINTKSVKERKCERGRDRERERERERESCINKISIMKKTLATV